MNDINELFHRDPTTYTNDDISQIVAYFRMKRTAAVSTRTEPGANLNTEDILSKITGKSAKPATKMRRI